MDSNSVVVDPVALSESEWVRSGSASISTFGSACDPDFGFAFNDSNFSDRMLRIEIMDDSCEARPESSGGNNIADWARDHKRRREENKEENDFKLVSEERILNNNHPHMDNQPRMEYQDEEAVAMAEEGPSGDEATNSNDSNWSMEYTAVVRVKTVHISSAILAAKSPFFLKLFSNGMMETGIRHATLGINASEEGPFMELLNFMYKNTLSTTSPTGLLDVLMVSDKFQVVSCMRYISGILQNLSMTPDSALLYLELPSSVLMADAIQPLTNVAKKYLVGQYKDLTKCQEEITALPLSGVEAVLSSSELQVASEDAVYDFLLKWAKHQYNNLEERRQVLSERLVHLIRFPYMTCRKLKKVLTCSDFDHEVASKLVLEALFFKAEAPHRQQSMAAEETAALNHRFVERAYKYHRVKVVDFELPRHQCVVYLDLKREECANLFPVGRVYSQAFHLGGQGFFLSAHCNMDQQSNVHCFGLFVGMQERGAAGFAVDYEFAARSRPTDEFVSKYKGNYTFTGGKAVGYRNLFAIPWSTFMAEDSLYFINGVLYLRAELTIRQ